MFRPTASPLKKGRFPFVAAVGLILLTTSTSPVAAKRSDLKLPAYDKLTTGAGPETNDVSASKRKIASAPRLTPVRLGEDSENPTLGPDDPANNGFLKSSVSMSTFAPKGPIDPAS